MRTIFGFLVAAFLLAPGNSDAQTVTSFEALRPLLRAGDRVIVTDDTGRTIRGTVSNITESSFDVTTRSFERRTFGSAPLAAQTRADGLVNGILWGAIGGWIPAAMMGEPAGSEGLAAPVAALFTVPGGIGVGALIDWLNRHEEVHVAYERKGAGRSVSLVPRLGNTSRGAALSIRW